MLSWENSIFVIRKSAVFLEAYKMLTVKNTFVKLEGIYVVKTHNDRKRKIIFGN